MDLLERLERWVRDPLNLKVSRGPNDLRAPFQQDMIAALAEITMLRDEVKRLRIIVGPVSNLPANDQTLVDRFYGGRRGDPG
jgi:hypothetical protein